MTRNELKDFYERKKASFSSTLSSVNQKINTISSIRLAVAILFLVVLYFGFDNHQLFSVAPIILIAFVLLVRHHSKLFDEKTHLENLLEVQRNELNALNGDVSHNSSGSEFIDVHHPYTHDLDIFGEGSIFQYINRSNTREGKRLLAERLSGKPGSPADVKRWQEAIAELRPRVEFRHEIQARSMQIDEQPDDRRQLEQWLTTRSFVYGKASYRTILNVFPIITLSLVVLAFIVDGITTFAILAAMAQWVFLGFHLKRVNAFHQYIGRKKNTLRKYAHLLKSIRQEPFETSLLRSVSTRAMEGDTRVQELSSLMSAFDARLNSMTNLFVNSLLLYDLQCVYRLERWKEQNAARLLEWLGAIRETEVLCSLGTFSFNHSGFVFPDLNDERRLTARGLTHPLLPADQRVPNDVALDSGASIMIITGANMAGKSTFLRSLGVNMVLALAGAPVCAESFSCPFMELRSGMRTADSLRENQSYFYAELDRLKTIMDELHAGKQLFILLDEILKGTNSTDKQAGSIALIRQLIDKSCLVVIATHDLALGELETLHPDTVHNYSFEATIENDHLFFDYKLRRGLAQKMNATFLMKKMGIISSE